MKQEIKTIQSDIARTREIYEAPIIEVIEVSVEKGFQASPATTEMASPPPSTTQDALTGGTYTY